MSAENKAPPNLEIVRIDTQSFFLIHTASIFVYYESSARCAVAAISGAQTAALSP